MGVDDFVTAVNTIGNVDVVCGGANISTKFTLNSDGRKVIAVETGNQSSSSRYVGVLASAETSHASLFGGFYTYMTTAPTE